MDFARHVGLVLAVPILLIVLVAAELARRTHPPKHKTLAERMREANPELKL